MSSPVRIPRGGCCATLAGVAAVAGMLAAATAGAAPLTVDEAVKHALSNSSLSINADASVLDAKSGLYGAYSGVLPHLSAGWSRSGSHVENRSSVEVFGSQVFPSQLDESENYFTTPSLSANWNVLDLSALSSVRSARSGMSASHRRRQASRNDVALEARRQFYEVVRNHQLATVASEALRLARDDERRVNALFEVGSVSKSDLLKAQVRTAQAELDSLTGSQAVTTQRIRLARLIGLEEARMDEVDTTLVYEVRDYDDAALLAEATAQRPDLRAAELELASAKSNVTSARLQRLPYVTVGGTATFNTKSQGFSRYGVFDTTGVLLGEIETPTRGETDMTWQAQVALNWDIFDGLATDSRNAAARARLLRARDTRDALRRNLESEVHEALIAYREAVERRKVAERALESATENLKLTQQKYNVGASTILELIDAQVQLQRARSDGVSALVAIRIAEAAVERVRGRTE
jgi:outer membrane protein